MKVICIFSAITIMVATSIALGQEDAPTAATSTQPTTSTNTAVASAPLIFWNRRITVFRSDVNKLSPEERAAKASERLAALPGNAAEWRIATTETTIGQYTGVMVSVNDQYVFAILTGDLDADSNETLQMAADHAVGQLRAALEARAQQRSVSRVLRGVGLAFAASLLVAFALWLVIRATGRLAARLDQKVFEQPRKTALTGFDLEPMFHSLNRTLTSLTRWALAIVLVYAWLTFVFLRFPYTQPWGQELGTFLLSIFTTLGGGVLHSIPGMFTVVVIFLLTRIFARLVSGLFKQVEKGDLTVPWLHPDTARATRYLVVVLIWIFAVIVAYPYVPGSETNAFKGVSVLLGLMISLGSAGLVNQIMSGLVVIYSRALKPGEFVQVGDDFGVVSDVGMLSTKIITRKSEEITIPHAVLVGAKTVNYSRHAANGQAQISTSVTIGYDAPWRQVHELLLRAAGKTSGVRNELAPRVWQRALSNFYVEYELVLNLDHPEERIAILSELHTHIQDAFNEAGIQIMVPAFESQPEKKLIVPKSEWFSRA